MRYRGVLLVLLPYACGSSATSNASKDSASSDLVASAAADFCSGLPGWNLPTDVASCVPAQMKGKVYDLNVGVDAGNCASRPTDTCTGSCGAGVALFEEITYLVGSCLKSESTFVVTFSEGCTDRFYLDTPYYDPDSIAVCMAGALAGTHFACAEQVPCWLWSESTLVPAAP